MKPIKIVCLINDSGYAYNLRRELIGRLVAEGNAVTVVCEPWQFRKELESETGASVIDLTVGRRETNPIQDVRLLCSYLRILRKEKPDLVLSFNIKPNVYGGIACRILGIRYMPNITGLGTAVGNPGMMQRLTTWLYKCGTAGAECVFLQNEGNRAFFLERGMLSKKSRTCMLPGSGVNLEYRKPVPYPEEGAVRFLYAARIMKEKGIDLFLAAAERFHSENVLFDVCGSCDDENYRQILQQAHDRGVIVYHGHQKDMNPHYAGCSCFLYPSYYPDGMSNVLLEAGATGRPAIAADRWGCRETVDDGVTGYIVPVNDEEAVLRAVEKFLNLTWAARREMGLAARKKVEKEFDREIVVEKYLSEISAEEG